MSLLKDFTDLGNFYADKGGNRPYLEKRSNAYLDDFTRNAGSNNYTKFRNGAHIGSIINYNGSYIYTNEGKTSSSVGVESPVIKKWPLLREGNLVDICDTIKASDGSEWHYVRIAGKYYGFVATKYIKRQRDRDTGKGY